MTLVRKWKRQDDYDGFIRVAIARHGNAVSVALVKAMIARESDFTPTAYRYEAHIKDASRGLMQVLLKTAQGMGYAGPADGLFDPATSIDYGVKYIAGNVRYARSKGYGLDSALSAYNGGFSGVRAGDGKRVTNEPGAKFINQAYVDWCLSTMRYFEQWEAQKAQAPSPSQQPTPPAVVPKPTVLSPVEIKGESGGVGVGAAVETGFLAALAAAVAYFLKRG